VLDLDGTLVTDEGTLRPRVLTRLRQAAAAGVRVMIATGRSELGAWPVLEELALDTPAIVFNGAGLFCPVQRRLLEERLLSDRVVQRCFEYAERHALMPLIQTAGAKYAPHPRDERERYALEGLEGLHRVAYEELPREYVIRVTFFSDRHVDSDTLAGEIESSIGHPLHLTHFPLNALATHRGSTLHVVDVQPPCRGKGEALRVLEERYGIAAGQVVAVGDADNDLPMLAAAGLGVAMANGMPRVLSTAGRVIGDNNSDTLAELVDELFGA
jgi:Cof subfamily protein (haloacid dehalogenase superfamily)